MQRAIHCRRQAGHRPRVRRLGLRPYAIAHRQGPAPELRTPCRVRRFRPIGNHDPTAEPRGMVHVHHRPGSRRPRHFRFHPPRSENDGAVPVDIAGGGFQPRDYGGRVAVPDLRRERRTPAAGTAVLGSAGGSRHRNDDHPHAGKFSPFWHCHTRVERHGNAGPPRDLRHVFVLHIRAVCVRRTGVIRRNAVSRHGRKQRRARRAARARQSISQSDRKSQRRFHAVHRCRAACRKACRG